MSSILFYYRHSQSTYLLYRFLSKTFLPPFFFFTFFRKKPSIVRTNRTRSLVLPETRCHRQTRTPLFYIAQRGGNLRGTIKRTLVARFLLGGCGTDVGRRCTRSLAEVFRAVLYAEFIALSSTSDANRKGIPRVWCGGGRATCTYIYTQMLL